VAWVGWTDGRTSDAGPPNGDLVPAPARRVTATPEDRAPVGERVPAFSSKKEGDRSLRRPAEGAV
jgi:hypothetical protein